MRNWMLLQKGAAEFRSNGEMSFLGADRFDVLRDLSIALSRLYRSGGRRNWSVGQHLLLTERLVNENRRALALVHDIEEPFTGDIPKPWMNSHPINVQREMNYHRDRVRDELIVFLGIKCGADPEEVKAADAEAFVREVYWFDHKNANYCSYNLGLTVRGEMNDLFGIQNMIPEAVAETWYTKVKEYMR